MYLFLLFQQQYLQLKYPNRSYLLLYINQWTGIQLQLNIGLFLLKFRFIIYIRIYIMFRLFKKKEKIKRELPPGTIRKEFHFEGNVQNIGFRFEVQSHAMPLGITGYAKNNDDGSVTAQLQGSLENIDKVILSLQSIDRIQIDSITEKDIPLDYYEKDFSIIY